MNTIAIGHGPLGNRFEWRDCGEAGYKYTPMGHAPSADDKSFRYVIFRDGKCVRVANDYNVALEYLRGVTVNGRWYDSRGSLKFVDKTEV